MISSDYRASKIIPNDIKLGPIPWVLNIVNSLFKFCVGVWVGGHRPASLNLFYDDSFLNLQHFDTKLMSAAQRGKKLRSENRPNNGFYGGRNCVG